MHDGLRWAAQVAGVALPARPRLAPGLALVDLGEGRAWLRGPDLTLDLPIPLIAGVVEVLLPLLDGRPLDEVLQQVRAPAPLARFALGVLRTHGVLLEDAPPPQLSPRQVEQLAPLVDGLAPLTADPWRAIARLQATQVAVLGEGALATGIADALRAGGFGAVTSDPLGANLRIAAADGPGFQHFRAVDQAGRSSNTPWLRATIEGHTLTLGPWMVPWQTACETCLQLRRGAHQDPGGWQVYGRTHAVARPLPAAVAHLAGAVVLEATRIAAEVGPPGTLGRQWVGSLGRPGLVAHPVMRVPRCPACGPQRTARDPWDRGGDPLTPR